ncbi:hypothetical protein V1478_000644 [Vespula squamosa]|uniref:Uncharacterized protein n=1 Tax=Vespula squamosa TaxID=30214 RepID=A0ABD2C629_VESSQ
MRPVTSKRETQQGGKEKAKGFKAGSRDSNGSKDKTGGSEGEARHSGALHRDVIYSQSAFLNDKGSGQLTKAHEQSSEANFPTKETPRVFDDDDDDDDDDDEDDDDEDDDDEFVLPSKRP